MKSNVIGAIVLIVLGAIFLLDNLGYADVNLARLLSTWWPAILIAVGAGMLLKRGN